MESQILSLISQSGLNEKTKLRSNFPLPFLYHEYAVLINRRKKAKVLDSSSLFKNTFLYSGSTIYTFKKFIAQRRLNENIMLWKKHF